MRQGVRDAKVEPTSGYKYPLKINRLRIYKTKKNCPEPFGVGAACIPGGSSPIVSNCAKKSINQPRINDLQAAWLAL